MAKSKPVGWFKDPEIRRSKALKVVNIFNEDDRFLPMLAGDLTRAKIFNVLVEHCTESISHKLSPELRPNDIHMIKVFRSLTEIIAYPLSEKKPSGLGSATKAHENIKVIDKVLRQLNSSLRILTEIRLTDIHKKFSPSVKQHITELIYFHENTRKKYIYSYKREDQFLRICGYAIDYLKSSGFSVKEVKQITNEALKYFNAKGYSLHIEDIDRIFKSDFYDMIHDNFSIEGENHSSRFIEKKSKKKPLRTMTD